MRVEWTTYPSPVGALTVIECDEGPLAVEFPPRAGRIRWAVRLRAAVPELHIVQGPCRASSALLDAYFAGTPRPFAFPKYLRNWFELSPAQIAVYKALVRIRFGETRSYDDVARSTGLHPRQIGWLVSANHLAILIPCHRVVGKDGSLVGYGGGLATKRWLLSHEIRAAGVVLR
ncbi:MAG TPA: methylated-DNA--[protein]-cysteine S-methyltransferase [Gemmatimonadales bacterium]|nr:methylated-DNA--[protein]-cysteine S-methyltransferase [Gemmatimonadales bacterium]